MAKIRAKQKLIVEDFPEQRDWIGKVFYLVNAFMSEVVVAINGSLLFGENITGQEQLLDFTFVSGSASFPQLFKWKLAGRPAALQVVSATEETSSTVPTPVMILVAWEYTAEGFVSITDIAKVTSGSPGAVSSLTASRRYKIRLRVTP